MLVPKLVCFVLIQILCLPLFVLEASLFEFSAAHRAFYWRIKTFPNEHCHTVETEGNVAFRTAMNASANWTAASITWLT